jgi:predicted ArsR family transcriptional regulator
VLLVNCPFHALVGDQRELVCGMNLDQLSGMAEAIGNEVLAARLEPSEHTCCVRLVAR